MSKRPFGSKVMYFKQFASYWICHIIRLVLPNIRRKLVSQICLIESAIWICSGNFDQNINCILAKHCNWGWPIICFLYLPFSLQHSGTFKFSTEQRWVPVGSNSCELPSFCPLIWCVLASSHVITRSSCH